MPQRADVNGLICSCCTIALANADTSGCEEFCGDGHSERLCQFGLEANETAVVGEERGVRSFRCAGCGDDSMDHAHELVVLSTL